MHSSSQGRRRSLGIHTRFADDSDREVTGSGHGAGGGAGFKVESWAESGIGTGKESTSATSTTTATTTNDSQSSFQSPQKQFHQQKLLFAATSPRPRPPPTSIVSGAGAIVPTSTPAPAVKGPNLFRHKPPPQPKNMDAENHQSMLRRQERPLYITTTTTSTTTTTTSTTTFTSTMTGTTAAGQVKGGGFPALIKTPIKSPTLQRTQQDVSFKHSPQQKQHQKQGHFTLPPKSPVRPLSFGSQSSPTSTSSPSLKTPKKPVLGTVISVPALYSTSWADERTNGNGRSKEGDSGDDGEGAVDEVSQVKVPDLTRRAGGATAVAAEGGLVSKDVGIKNSTASTTTTSQRISLSSAPVRIKQLDIPNKSRVESAIFSAAKLTAAATVAAVKAMKEGDEDEFDIMDGDMDESLRDIDWGEEFRLFEDEDRRRNRDRECQLEQERQLERDRDRGPRVNGGGASGLKTSSEDVKSVQKETRPKKEPATAVGEEMDLPYSDSDLSDGERRRWKQRCEERLSQVQEAVDVTSNRTKEEGGNMMKTVFVKRDVIATNRSKDAVNRKPVTQDTVAKRRGLVQDLDRQWDEDRVRDRNRNRERERNLRTSRDQDAQRKGTSVPGRSTPEKSWQHEIKTPVVFNPSPPAIETSSDEEPSRSQPRQRLLVESRVKGMSLSGRSSQEVRKREVKEFNSEPNEVSEIESSSEDGRLPWQRQPRPLKQGQRPNSSKSPKKSTWSLPLNGESDRSSTSSQPIYKPKHANLNRSADAQDSDLELEDDIFSAAPILPQLAPPPRATSVSESQSLSKASSAGSSESASSTMVNGGGSKFACLSDSSDLEDLDPNDPFRDHSAPRKQSTGSKNKDEPAQFVLKKRENRTRDSVENSSRSDQQQRDHNRPGGRARKDFKEGDFFITADNLRLVGDGNGSSGSLSNRSDRLVENRSGNCDVKSNGGIQRSGTSKARPVRPIQTYDEDEEDGLERVEDVKPRYLVAESGGGSSATLRKDRSAFASRLKENSRTSEAPRTKERDVLGSRRDDRDQRRDRGLDQSDRLRKQRSEESGRDTVKEEHPAVSPFDALLTPTSAAKKMQIAEKNRTSQKRRTRPNSTTDEDSDSPANRPTTSEPATGLWTTLKRADEPPSTPTRKSELDGVRKQVLPSPRKSPRIADEFKLPSPRRKRIRTITEMMSLSDDDYPSQDTTVKEGEVLCPYCQDVLPKDMSLRLRSSLAKILHGQEERRQAQKEFLRRQQIRDGHLGNALEADITGSATSAAMAVTGTATPRKPGVPRPKRLERLQKHVDLTSGDSEAGGGAIGETDAELEKKLFSKVSAVDKFEFCRIHVAETKIIPAGLEQNYPLSIPFEELPRRIQSMEPDLLGIIHGTVASPYLERALANYRNMGNGARNPQVVLAGMQMTLPGYYGSKGTKKITEVLVKLFLDTNILTHEVTRPQEPIEYIQQVLIPETGVRLILEDRRDFIAGEGGGGISVEEAQAIMLDSVEFGNYVHDVELPF
ncbi:hypothetical protein BGW39_002373 [Mortierella sp. 14UC]|nr:hypothetical protein BGW39_002373 [Mortierella sp. 14UC]